ncbi:antiviral reverse transcriptase Drt3b [Enterobacter hormaechei]|uniref:antiviral reverse transcriptase Drt3b n=1 Tax=Enterobacter hormaechei TaxID=158836 RepID=UPI003076037B
MNIQNIKLDKKDFRRALLTDTSPSDAPIIFSNDGFYINSHLSNQNNGQYDPIVIFFKKIIAPKYDSTLSNDAERAKKQSEQSYPLKFKIFKNETKLRTLSLIHPRSQYNYVEFYRDFASAITSLCSQSQLSIRAPVKIANSFYTKKKLEDQINYKKIKIDTLDNEIWSKHASSFFTYKGYDRIYKLFENGQYVSLEKKFNVMWSLDIANCFDSIYTHTISWAIKNKEFIKSNLKKGRQFGDDLDSIMQRSNNNETNGIPVGAEFSRVFAELIFQDIDNCIIKKIDDIYGHKLKIHYEVLRYVDDYFIFAINESVAERVHDIISDELGKYNLYLGDKKLSKLERPFLTNKSEMVIEAKKILTHFDENIFSKKDKNSENTSKLNYIHRPDRLTKSTLDLIKSRCCESDDGYKNVAPYLLAALSKRIMKIVDMYDHVNDQDDINKFHSAIIIITKMMFFFHCIKPNVTSSNRIAKAIISVEEFYKKHSQVHLDLFKDIVMHQIQNMRFSNSDVELRDGFTSIEKMNVILATSNFGDNYLMDLYQLNEALDKINNYNYFFIISLLYYYKDHTVFEDKKKEIENIIKDKFEKNFELEKNSELAHLFLDTMSCKYISREVREVLYRKFLSKFSITRSNDEVEADLSYLLTRFWFVKWNQLNNLSLLERKELRTGY